MNAFVALMAYGAQDYKFSGNPETSLFDKKMKEVTHSTFTYISILATTKDHEEIIFNINKFNECNKTPESISESCFDLIGDCYIDIQSPTFSYDNIEYCIFEFKPCVLEKYSETQWTTLEVLTPKSFTAFATMYPNDYTMTHNDKTTMIPLPFCFTRTTQDYLPIMNKTLYRIRMKLIPSLEYNQQLKLACKAVYLDMYEHRMKRQCINHFKNKIYCVSSTKKYTINLSFSCIQLDYKNLVRDLQIFAENTKTNKSTTIQELVIKFNGVDHCALNSHMTTIIIPRKYYNISQSFTNPSLIHYIPFCHDPLGSTYTSAVNVSCIDFSQLYMTKENNEETEITIFAREFKTLLFNDGECELELYTQ